MAECREVQVKGKTLKGIVENGVSKGRRGQEARAHVEITGCRLRAREDGGWWRSGIWLRSKLVQKKRGDMEMVER